MEERNVDRETVDRTKTKLMKKAAEKRAEREENGGGDSAGVAEARRKFVENRRLQGIE